ncbi:MAG: hypothetical protein AAF304_05105, partial [Pseudomonadota bacterium]
MFHRLTSIIQLTFIQLRKACSILLLGIFLSTFTYTLASQPDWVLSGTFLNNEHAHAMFVDENGDELLLELGDDIQGCNLINVLKNSAAIRCKDKDYSLLIRSSVGDILMQAEFEQSQVQKHTVVLSKAEVGDYIVDKQRLVTEIGFLPLVENDQVVGFTLSKIKPDTKAASLGLYNGDVIKSVNGVSAAEQERFMQTVHELSEASEFTLEVDRYGKMM